MAGHRCRNDIRCQTARLPDHLTRGHIVGTGAFGGGNHRLPPAIDFDDERRGPTRPFIPGLAPDFRSCFGVECDDERLSLVVPRHDQPVARQRRGRTFAKTSPGLHIAQVLLPQQRSIQIVAVQPARTKGHKESFAIGDRRGRGIGVGLVPGLVGHLPPGCLLPEHPARFPIDRHDDKVVIPGGFWSSAKPTAATPGVALLLRCRRGSRDGRGGRLLLRRFNRREQEDPVFPDDRRREPAARQLDLPFDVLLVTPGRRRPGSGGNTGTGRAPPGGPGGLRRIQVLEPGERDEGEQDSDTGETKGRFHTSVGEI
jgi:hypothetical protein